MNTVTANELKTRGVSAVEEGIQRFTTLLQYLTIAISIVQLSERFEKFRYKICADALPGRVGSSRLNKLGFSTVWSSNPLVASQLSRNSFNAK